MSNVEKLHHLKYLLDIFFEPNDVIDKLPGIGLFTTAFDEISRIAGSSQAERKQRINIFLAWLQQEDDGNRYGEFVDVLRQDENYEWLTPLLEDRENDPSDFLDCFKYLSKPKKVSLIFNKIFQSLANINVVDIIGHVTVSLTESDREEIRKTVTNKSNRFGLIALLNKLIYKKPVWIEEFVKAVESLGYAPANSMFDEEKYLFLSEPLKEYLGLFELPENDDHQENMEITEEFESSNYATAQLFLPPLIPVHGRQAKNDYTAAKVVDQCKVSDKSVAMTSSSTPINGVFNKFGDTQHPNGRRNFETWCCRLRHASGDWHDDDSTTMGRDAGPGLQDGQRQVIYNLEQAGRKNISILPRRVGNEEMFCQKCNLFICETEDLIRINGTHHTVARNNFMDQCCKSNHPLKGSAFGIMTHLYKIQCNQCKQGWGYGVRWKDRVVPVLTIKGFKLQDSCGKIFQPSSWKKVRLEIHEMKDDPIQFVSGKQLNQIGKIFNLF